MSTITLPNIRVGSDLQIRVRLKDGGVAIDWSTLSNIKACIYSDAQRALAGRCAFSIDEEDNTLLVCTYAANKPQYLGVNRIVVSAKYMGETKTYDKPAFSFVRWTADQEGEEITIDDPDVDVEIDVEDISSSILQEAVDAAFTAADRANDAAAAAEHMVDIHTGPEGKSAYEVAVDEGFVGTEEEWLASLVGPQGAQGIQGETGEAAGFGSVSAALQEDGGDPSVVVAASGEDTSKNFAFTFKNLKGDKGDKGDQGNTGSSVDYPYELVNNCTTDDATKGLAASQGVALQAEVSQLEAEIGGNLMTTRAKNALLAVFQKVAYAVPDVSAELTELENALFNLDEIIGIEAVFNQVETVYDQGISSLDDLREELVVKAVYGDNTKVPILGYSLSGDISVSGTDTITVSYLGFTDTFDVVVTHYTAQMVFSIGNGDITKYQGGSTRYDNSTKYGISNFGSSANRRVFLAETGDVPLRKTENGNSIGKYPIPIPRNASKVTVAVTPNTTKVAGGILKLRDGYYPNDTGTGFLEYAVGTQEYVFSDGQKEFIRKGQGYFYGSGATVSGNYSSSNEPTEFTITFE